ncbi:MAG: site-2 protease family protein [Propionibacteriaceae bacterium]|jgi:membrane-associated protease RseP (regulator of RpoE activity)|nr:site-2 protease family protein [Propionibacteriaceae bacterium]
MGIVYGIAFFLLILVTVALHEVGHMVPAKIFGVRVPQYFVGFGPTAWSFKKGGTEYGIKWFPLGGFVRLLGMYPPARSGKETRFKAWMDEARGAEWDEITADDVASGNLFYQKKTWQKIIVMFGGPCMNLVLAFLIFWGINGIYGVNEVTTTVASVQQCIPAQAGAECTSSDPLTPAVEAGLEPGDKIVSFNGTQISSQPQLSGLIQANRDGEARISVERGGSTVELTPVHTRLVSREYSDGTVQELGYLGFTAQVGRFSKGPGYTLEQMWDMTTASVEALVRLPVSAYEAVADTVSGQQRDPNTSPMSIVGASVVAGDVAASPDYDPGVKVAMFASLLGSLNLFLAIFNLVPLPPLDGGHIAAAIYEWLKRKGAKLLGRPDPGYFDTAKVLPITFVVGGILLVLGVALILADIINPIDLI